MIITRTPVRVSFLGGGTDYPAYFRQHGGATLVTTIDKYTYVTVNHLTEFFDHHVGVYYSRVERVKDIDDIQHPAVRECLRHMGIERGIEIHIASDLPARTGLGSSSSFTVGLLKALYAFRGQMTSGEELAAQAVYVEQELIRERVGCQDQYACALGGLRHLEFFPDGSTRATQVVLSSERLRALQQRLILLYTGIQRSAHEVLEEQVQRTEARSNMAELESLKGLVRQGIEVLTGEQDLCEFGAVLHESWQIKRGLSSQVSTAWIDVLYERARQAGAVGGKLLGAGGGGFLLLYVEPDRRECVRRALPELREAAFEFENDGSQVIFYRL